MSIRGKIEDDLLNKVLVKELQRGSEHTAKWVNLSAAMMGMPDDEKQRLLFSGKLIYKDKLYLYRISNMKWYEYDILANDFDYENYEETKNVILLAYCGNMQYHGTVGFYIEINGKYFVKRSFKELYDISYQPMLVGRLAGKDGRYIGYVVLNRDFRAVKGNFALIPARFNYGDTYKFCNGYVQNGKVHINGVADCNVPVYDEQLRLLNNKYLVVGYNDKYVVVTGNNIQKYPYTKDKNGVHIMADNAENILNGKDFLTQGIDTGVVYLYLYV